MIFSGEDDDLELAVVDVDVCEGLVLAADSGVVIEKQLV